MVASPRWWSRWADPCAGPRAGRRSRSAGWRTPTTAPVRRTPGRRPPGWSAPTTRTCSSSGPAPASSPSSCTRSATGCWPPTRSPTMLQHLVRRLPRTPGRGRRRREDPAAGPVGGRRRRRPGLPLVRPDAGAAGDRPGAAARRPPVAGLEPPRRADPVGPAARCADRDGGAGARPDPRAAGLTPVRLRGDLDLPVLAAAGPRAAARPGAAPARTSR